MKILFELSSYTSSAIKYSGLEELAVFENTNISCADIPHRYICSFITDDGGNDIFKIWERTWGNRNRGDTISDLKIERNPSP